VFPTVNLTKHIYVRKHIFEMVFEITIGLKKHEFPTVTTTKRTYLQVTCDNCTQIYNLRGVDSLSQFMSRGGGLNVTSDN
jgi:hypothetical protein